jgi:hypothetical protein
VDTLRYLGVEGSQVQAGEAWDSLSLWKYAIQAASQEMTARPAGKAVGNADLFRWGSRYGQADIEAGSEVGSIRGVCEASS